MPILNDDLSWKFEEGDSDGTHPSSNLWIMGPLAGLTLGPDALNLMGARHGAVRIAKTLRKDPQWQDLATE